MAIPASVEVIQESCFDGFKELTTIVFQTPSKLGELRALPLSSVEEIDISNRLEMLTVDGLGRLSKRAVIRFGRASALSNSTSKGRGGALPRVRADD
jgi:hypothetical protein